MGYARDDNPILLILKKNMIALLDTRFGQCCYSMAFIKLMHFEACSAE